MSVVNSVAEQNTINRTSDQQKRILAVLADAPRLMGAGDIAAELGLPRTPAARASLSRSLRRLADAGAVTIYHPEVSRSGRGHLYAAAAEAGA
jgi:hypothetical protein